MVAMMRYKWRGRFQAVAEEDAMRGLELLDELPLSLSETM